VVGAPSDRGDGGAGMPEALDLAALRRRAADLWKRLAPGSVVWLSGELGAGKTTVVQAIATAAGAERARSPSFALIHEYASPHGTLVHADCYRLRSPEEARDLDLYALAQEARLLLIEWPEKAGSHAPPPDAHIRLGHAADPDRRTWERIR
jgi:tRNA threonylcarbamoyl adenosine modification protein YjeE